MAAMNAEKKRGRFQSFWLIPMVLMSLSGCERKEMGMMPVMPTQTEAPSPSEEAMGSTPSLPEGAAPCGALECLQFDSPEMAFKHILARKPVVLAVGESHPQKGKEAIPSNAKRFTDLFLPMLQGKASDLVLELMAPQASCHESTQQVRNQHAPVTEKQTATAQNEYIWMGEKARALGIVPDLLRPSCDDLQAISHAEEDAIALTLETIARLTTEKVKGLLSPGGRKPEEADLMVVTYGGILHNDPSPSEIRASWSFGPAFVTQLGSQYVALDIFVPEFIEDTEVWRSLPWFEHYDGDRLGGKTTVFRLEDGAFVLIFPRMPDR